MKKSGFTLAELIISLSIIGVVAAISMATINAVMPDKNKAMVLKYRATIEKITSELLSTDGIFYPIDNIDNETGDAVPDGKSDCIGLECTGQPLISPYNTSEYANEYKYLVLLGDKLGLGLDNYASDGVQFDMTKSDGYYNLVLDLDKENTDNCTFSSDCSEPDRFVLKVDKYGNVTAGDALTDAYFRNPYNMADKKNDLQKAKALLSSESY